HLVPSSIALGVRANARGGIVHDTECVEDHRRTMAAGVRYLVNASERGEHEIRTIVANAPCDGIRDLAIDLQPARAVATEMRASGAKRRTRSDRADAMCRGQAAPDHVQCAEA